jgi:AcrR family transcriptional regulator
MARPKTPAILARKQPKQERSTQLVAAILEAAIRVLQAEGAQCFTMARVAEKAGVSVGSLYQYFPNKESILFQLQREEWLATTTLLEKILVKAYSPPTGTDKLMRLHSQSIYFENGRIFLPRQSRWLKDYVAEITGFPGTKFDDQVDSTTQFLDYMRLPGSTPMVITAEVLRRSREPMRSQFHPLRFSMQSNVF